jgi:hypothetical protein
VIDRKASSTLANTANLIDLPIDSMTTGGPDPAAIIKRIEDTVAKLNQLQRTRKTILNDLKERVQRDDISKALLNSRKPQEVVIKEELAKFEGDRHKIQQTIQEQHALMKSMERDHDALTGTNILGELEKLTQARSNITQSLKDSRVAYDGLRTNLQQGLSFYKELTKCTEKLTERTQRLMDERKQEREKQQAGLADSDAKLLADKLSKLSTSAPSPAAPPLAASAPVYVPTTQGYPPPPQQQHQSAPPPQTPYYYGQPQMPPPQQPLYQHQAYYGAPPAPTTASTASYTQPSGLPASLGNSLSLPAHLQQPLAPVQQSQPAQMQQQQPPYAAPYQQAWPPGGSMQQPPYAVPQYPQQPYMPGYPPPPAQQQPYYYNPQGGPPPQQQQQQPLPQSRPPQNHSLI